MGFFLIYLIFIPDVDKSVKRIESWQCPRNNLPPTFPPDDLTRSNLKVNMSTESTVQELMRGHKTPLLAIHMIFTVLAAVFLILVIIAIVSYYQASRR